MPEDYAAYALECKRLGYTAYKIHSHYYWDPATRQAAPPRPSHVDWDIKTCRAVREAVGDDMVLMYDPWGTYNTYADALRVGRVLEELGFYWYEHPMPEHRVEPYIKLAEELTIPICSPEIAEGGLFTRADWILRRASDISRIDVLRGGITGAMKTAAVAEAFGVRCEPHMSGFGNLQFLGATSEDVCEYYERGLLAPGVDYDATPAYLEQPAMQWTPTASSPCQPNPAWATRSYGITSTSTACQTLGWRWSTRDATHCPRALTRLSLIPRSRRLQSSLLKAIFQ